jgi:hypothetical protein
MCDVNECYEVLDILSWSISDVVHNLRMPLVASPRCVPHKVRWERCGPRWLWPEKHDRNEAPLCWPAGKAYVESILLLLDEACVPGAISEQGRYLPRNVRCAKWPCLQTMSVCIWLSSVYPLSLSLFYVYHYCHHKAPVPFLSLHFSRCRMLHSGSRSGCGAVP